MNLLLQFSPSYKLRYLTPATWSATHRNMAEVYREDTEVAHISKQLHIRLFYPIWIFTRTLHVRWFLLS